MQPVVLVDARNVVRSRWPNLPSEWFLAVSRRWAAREGVALVVVFDGQAPGGVVGREELDAQMVLVGTQGESADDWIAREAERLASVDRRVRVVTSDRELRRRVAPHAEDLVGGGAFATLLEDLAATDAEC